MASLFERLVSFVLLLSSRCGLYSLMNAHSYAHEIVDSGTIESLQALSFGFFPLGIIAKNFFGSQKSGQVNRNGSCGCRWECHAMLINGFVVRKNCLFIFL